MTCWTKVFSHQIKLLEPLTTELNTQHTSSDTRTVEQYIKESKLQEKKKIEEPLKMRCHFPSTHSSSSHAEWTRNSLTVASRERKKKKTCVQFVCVVSGI